MYLKQVIFTTFLLFGSYQIAFSAEMACTELVGHSYNSQNNTLTLKLKKALSTIEGMNVQEVSVLTTENKFKAKMASTRKEAKLCFQNLSLKKAQELNLYLSKAAKKKVTLYQYAMADKILLVQREDIFGFKREAKPLL